MLDDLNHQFLAANETAEEGDDSLITRGQAMMLTIGGEMTTTLHRLDPVNGMALGDALRDMIMSGEVDPAVWPLPDAIEILATADPRRDGPAAVVRGALERLMVATDQAA